MASRKVGVYLSEHSVKVLDSLSRSDDEVSVSSRVNSVIERYWWIVKDSLPELSNSEWMALLNVYAGSELTSYNPPYRIASDMMDDRGEIDLAAMSDSDPEYAALVKRVHGMSQAEQCAIIDFCQKFWARTWSDQADGNNFADFNAIRKELVDK